MKTSPTATVGAILKAALEARQVADRQASPTGEVISQAQLAHECGMKPQQFNQILAGNVPNPGILTVAKIAHAIGADLATLFPDSRVLTFFAASVSQTVPPPTKRSESR